MTGAADIAWLDLALGYLLLIAPLAVLLWLRVPIVGDTVLAAARMTVQLLFVGFYLRVLFVQNRPELTVLWLVAMIAVAELSILRGCQLRLARFALPIGGALAAGLALPLFFVLGIVLRRPSLLDAPYAIPVGGMILGNCLRAIIVGLRSFYDTLRKDEKAYQAALAQGATLREAVHPYRRDALHAALAPTVATMATIGLVSLPGMMTGVILGGNDPMTAIKYQIVIMIAIFVGTALTAALAIHLSMAKAFTPYGTRDPSAFRP